MIDQSENLIFIGGVNKTPQIKFIKYENHSYIVVFNNSDKAYKYSSAKVCWMQNPTKIDTQKYTVEINGYVQKNIKSVSLFSNSWENYYFITFSNGFGKLIQGNEIRITETVLKEPKSKKVFDYLSEVASANALKTEDDENLLSKQYDKIEEILPNSVLARYLNPKKFKNENQKTSNPIFPFGCNSSQYKAVKQALENQISVVQGPPGTGKTQTILNIIANLLINNKSVIVVSNNNSATENVLEKLQKYNFGFLVAPLGNSENKQRFIDSQSQGRIIPNELNDWKSDDKESLSKIKNLLNEISEIYSKNERLATLKQELSDWKLEFEHFQNSNDCDIISTENISINADKLLDLLNIQQSFLERRNKRFEKFLWFVQKLKFKYIYKLNTTLLNFPNEKSIRKIQYLFYCKRISELRSEISDLESFCKSDRIKQKTQQLTQLSMSVLKDTLFRKYSSSVHESINVEFELMRNADRFLEEFPIVLSTTFSAVSSVRKAVYDYVIMDEASQVTVETGALALSCAKNAVIVGDTMQLPNVVTNEDKQKLDAIIRKYEIEGGYNSSENSFLESIIKILPDVKQTLLKEHYRCNPEIINFCNQKFYGGNLVLMTEKSDSKAIGAIKTVKGNHCRGHQNQREIDIICNEILPKIECNPEDIGIIAPYNSQVNAIKRAVDPKIEVATVHKYQGRDKDVIIMSVTDDTIGDFADNANLLNVAVSRAKNKFYLIVSGNEQEKHGNISDLLDYIEYNGGEISDSKICSVYDMLYKQYAQKREEFFKKNGKVSIYDSENLTYCLLREIISENEPFRCLDIVLNYPVNLLLADTSLLNEDERTYISYPTTHVDFLIYNRVSKKIVLTIEVDGYSFHHEGTKQNERDKMKNHILSLYGIALLRLSTTGSNEKEIITEKLTELVR
ncbi:MAG: AAA family ATPase [Bacteroidaceae bacterium]|nr:AAA family ATPase [Bacteroidaceae bacterium]